MKTLIENWKTSVAGVVAIGLTIGLLMKVLTFEQFVVGLGLTLGGGLLVGGDAKKN